MSQHNQAASPGESVPEFYREVLPSAEVNDLTELLRAYLAVNVYDPPRCELLTQKEILSLPQGTIDATFVEELKDTTALTRRHTIPVICHAVKIFYVNKIRHVGLDTLLKKTGHDELPSVFQRFRWQVIFGDIPSDTLHQKLLVDRVEDTDLYSTISRKLAMKVSLGELVCRE
jgi:hypothetical protein